MKLPVPVNIITGTLGVGKTTAVQHILRNKPPEEKWALLVNEFGALGIDSALVTASIGTREGAAVGASPPGSAAGGVVVRELAGGCLCCTLSGPLGVAIAQLVRQARPDRLIIEPSGLGHPAGLLDVLHGEHLRSALELRAVICLVDIRAAAALEGLAPAGQQGAGACAGPQAAVTSETFQDQVNVADVLVGHKADLADAEQQRAFGRWAEQLYPPKMKVVLASHGQIDLALLDLPRTPVFRPMFAPKSHVSRRRAAQRASTAATGAATAPPSRSTVASGAAGVVDSPDGIPESDMGTAAREAAVDLELGTSASASGLEGLSLDGTASLDEARAAPEASITLTPGKPARFPSSPTPRPVSEEPSSSGPSAEQQRLRAHGSGSAGSGAECGLQEPDGEASCGWLFSAEDVFDRQRLTEVLSTTWCRASRLKGVFRVGKSSYVVPYMHPDGRLELQPISYRRESRLEVIVAAPPRPRPRLPCGTDATATTTGGGGGGGAVEEAAAAAQVQDREASSGRALEAVDGPSGLAAAVAAADWDAVERVLISALR